MKSIFEVGEVVVLAVAIRNPLSAGEVREVIATPQPHPWIDPQTDKIVLANKYLLRAPSGSYGLAFGWQLRNKGTLETPELIELEGEAL